VWAFAVAMHDILTGTRPTDGFANLEVSGTTHSPPWIFDGAAKMVLESEQEVFETMRVSYNVRGQCAAETVETCYSVRLVKAFSPSGTEEQRSRNRTSRVSQIFSSQNLSHRKDNQHRSPDNFSVNRRVTLALSHPEQ
jgi:hypothetical protein